MWIKNHSSASPAEGAAQKSKPDAFSLEVTLVRICDKNENVLVDVAAEALTALTQNSES